MPKFATCHSFAIITIAMDTAADTSLIQFSLMFLMLINIYYCTSGRAVQENIRFKACSIGPTVGRANTKANNRIFSCTARPKECDNIFIICDNIFII